MFRKKVRTLQILLFLSTIIAVMCSLFIFKSGTNYNKLLIDSETYDKLVATKTFSNECSYSIFFNDNEIFYDTQNNFYLYSLVSGGINSYNPTVYVVASDGSEDNDYKIAFLSDISQDSIARGDSIPLIIYSDNYYFTSELQCTTLPVISINTFEDITDSKDVKTDMEFSLFDNRNNVSDRLFSSQGQIHVRGASSMVFPKKSYRISLSYMTDNGEEKKSKYSLLGMRKDEDWILYSIYDDPEKIRNIFSTNLWKFSAASDNSYNLDTGTEYKYVELFMNGEYNGLYALGYPMQASQVNISENNPSAVMYRRLMGYGNELQLESDGAPASFRIQSKSGRELFSLLREYFIQIDKSHADADSLESLIDVDNAADFFLFINLIQGWDNIYKNQNIAIYKGSNSINALYIPWDMDLTWGTSTEKIQYGITPETNFEFNYEAFYNLLQISPDNTISLLQKKYDTLRKNAWSDESILAMLDSYEKDIFGSGAYYREMERWPSGSYIGKSYVGEGDIDENAAYDLTIFKEYVLSRLHYFDNYVATLSADPEYEYSTLTFGSDIIHDCVSQLFSDPNELVLLEINNSSLWNEDYYYEFMAKWGIPSEYVSADAPLKNELENQYFEYNNESIDDQLLNVNGNTDLIMMFDNDEFSYCDNFFSGNSFETAMGELVYYQADDGSCGIYLDGNEILTENAFERDFDLRVIHVDANTREVTRIEEHKVYEE